jgi:hypothetical protein
MGVTWPFQLLEGQGSGRPIGVGRNIGMAKKSGAWVGAAMGKHDPKRFFSLGS